MVELFCFQEIEKKYAVYIKIAFWQLQTIFSYLVLLVISFSYIPLKKMVCFTYLLSYNTWLSKFILPIETS